jgi:hypothetical protein
VYRLRDFGAREPGSNAQPPAIDTPGSDFKAKLAGYGIKQNDPSYVLWNFEKFLMLAAIDAELAKPAP